MKKILKYRLFSNKIWQNKILQAWRINNEGVTVIEFAMIAPIFFGLLFMLIETGILFTAQQLLETAVTSASRTVLTGETQSGLSSSNTGNDPTGKDAFRDKICDGVSGLINVDECKSGLMINMQTFPATTDSAAVKDSLALPLKGDGTPDLTKMTCAGFGGGDEYMFIRAFYQYPIYADFGSIFGTESTWGKIKGSTKGHSLISGTVVMKIEPFSGTGSQNKTPCQ